MLDDSDCSWVVEAWAVELTSCTVWAGSDEKVTTAVVVVVLVGSVVRCVPFSVVEM